MIEPHNSCRYDYLKIFNGPSVDSPLVDTYCGENRPDQFQSGSNTVTLLFQSDFSVSAGGFRVEWSEDGSGNMEIFLDFGLVLIMFVVITWETKLLYTINTCAILGNVSLCAEYNNITNQLLY